MRFAIGMLLLAVSTSGCTFFAPHPEDVANDRLTELLATYGFVPFIPFKTTDFPGTLFALADGPTGVPTELTISGYQETFTVEPPWSNEVPSQLVALMTELKQDQEVKGSAALSLLESLIHISAGSSTTATVSLRFVAPARVYRLSLSALAALRFELRDDVRAVLQQYKSQGQLDKVFVVLECLQVAGLEATVTVADQTTAEALANDAQSGAKVEAHVSKTGSGSFTVTSSTPLLIGYKAISFPDSILRDQVSLQDQLEGYATLEPVDVMRLRGMTR